MRIAALSLAATIAVACPAQAQFATFDASQAVHALDQIKQYEQMITHAKDQVTALQQALKTLPSGAFSATDVTQELDAAQQVLTTARQACTNYQNVAPNVCRVREQMAAQQASTTMRDLSNLKSIRNAASGSISPVQATQANALGIIALAKKLQDAADRDLAAEQAREYADAIHQRVLGHGNLHI